MSDEIKKEEQLNTFLTEMGNAIREVKGTTGLVNARDMVEIVRGMSGGGNVEARVKANSITITKAKVNIVDDTTIELEV